MIEKLCARLMGTVANKPADEFYNEFNLNKGTVFSEFYFKEMMQIFHFPGMELWPKLTTSEDLGTKKQGKPPPQIYLSLVCFRPPGFASSKSGPIKRRVKLAHEKACDMLCSCFDSIEDHKCIKVAMANCPTIAIFMCQMDGQDLKKNKHNLRKSILDVKDASSLHCLAAVNYYQVGTRTVVLWLSTTLEAPPVHSRNVTWQKLGLATYLLCMLVKQHTGFCTGGPCQIVLCLCRLPVREILLRAGFI